MTVMRIWRTQVDPARVSEYEQFAQSLSLPMFRQQQGFLGVVFGGRGSDRVVVSFWEDETAVERLATSTTYQATVRDILGTGFLIGTPTTDVFAVHGGQLPQRL